jgi:hypothetical protein
LAAGWSDPGIAYRALEEFPSEAEKIWAPKGKPTAYWLDRSAYATATATEERTMVVSVRPVEGTWSIEATYRFAELGETIKHQGLAVAWRFFSAGEEPLEVPGEVVYRDVDEPHLDDAEQFARMLMEMTIGPG